MKFFLLVMTVAAGALITAGCFTTAIVEKNPPGVVAAQAPATNIATPQMSPDVNFKASNAMPGGPGM